jgi:NAD(P)-dependent dehydrogenase (short-subunit alcohol dehydrogenase family)
VSQRTILVTGASRGIGRAIAARLLDEGCQVIGLARSPATDQLGHSSYTAVPVDLSALGSIQGTIKAILDQHPSLDGVVSVAGRGDFGELEQFSAATIQASIELNLLSHMMLARAVIPQLKGLKRGDLIFMGSEASLSGAQRGSLYCAAKFGLRGFAQSLRRECARCGVRVGVIHPGMVRTGFFDELSFRPGAESSEAIEPADVAQAVWTMLSVRRGTVIDELVLSPQQHVIDFGPKES